MKGPTVALAVLILAQLNAASAHGCEPVSPPPFTRSQGLSYFIATTTKGAVATNVVRANIIIGRTDAMAMPMGAAILVSWSHGADCKPLAWNVTRDGPFWSPPETAAFY